MMYLPSIYWQDWLEKNIIVWYYWHKTPVTVCQGCVNAWCYGCVPESLDTLLGTF